jgi:hypothetical protein
MYSQPIAYSQMRVRSSIGRFRIKLKQGRGPRDTGDDFGERVNAGFGRRFSSWAVVSLVHDEWKSFIKGKAIDLQRIFW